MKAEQREVLTARERASAPGVEARDNHVSAANVVGSSASITGATA